MSHARSSAQAYQPLSGQSPIMSSDGTMQRVMSAISHSHHMFNLFRIGVHVDIAFVLFVILFAAIEWSNIRSAQALLVAPILVFAVFVHELGHASAALSFGLEASIHLSAFGGFCRHNGAVHLFGRVIILASGGMLGIIIGVALYLVKQYAIGPMLSPLLNYVFHLNMFYMIYLNIANLVLPINDLDGGQLFGIIVRRCVPDERRATMIVASVGCVLACTLCLVVLFLWQSWFSAMILASLAFKNIRDMSAVKETAPTQPTQQQPHRPSNQKFMTLADLPRQ